MLFQNARYLNENFEFVVGGFETENGRFTRVFAGLDSREGVNLEGAYVLPGLIDVHSHGNSGVDFSDGDYDGLQRAARYLAQSGVTSFAPASLTLPYDRLAHAYAAVQRLHDEKPAGASRMLGIHMEGPFFSEKKKGAQNGAYLRLPDYEAFRALNEGCGGLIKIVDVAPELDGAIDFVRRASQDCTVSVAHTDAAYDDARAAFAAGATHLTHLYNGMPSIHHRTPGVIPAAVENPNVRAEIICDGIHVHPASIRLAFSMFGAERMVLISDALRCCGMPDGEYELGGQTVRLEGKTCRVPSGSLAGSVTNLFECMKNTVSFGIPLADAVRAASYNPACALGAQNEVGSIAVGKYADFIVCSQDLERKAVYLNGEKL